ncbi:hypothetical protein IFM89_030110, partial [Coptis chinensis]
KLAFTKKQADLLFPPYITDDFPVAIQISHKYGLIYVIMKLGLLCLCDLETATTVYRNRNSPDPIILTSEASSVGGFYAVNRRGQVLLATVNEATIVPFVIGQLNNLELAVNLAKRGNLAGAENIALPSMCIPSLLGINFLQSIPFQAGQTPPLLLYFATLLSIGKLNAFESLELSKIFVKQNKNLLESWLDEDKLECSEEQGNLVKPA